MRDLHEQKRREILLNQASKRVGSIEAQFSAAQDEIHKERTQYFEKLALGAGGTITLVVSFIGSKSASLQPRWLLRSALVTLALAMASAMYRNWRYPYYLLAVHLKHLDKAMLEKALRKRDCMLTTDAASLETGDPINAAGAEADFQRVKPVLERKIKEFSTQERRVYKEIQIIETGTLLLIVSGIVMLIALAWRNF